MVNGDLFNAIGVLGKLNIPSYIYHGCCRSRHLVMSKDKKQVDVAPPKPTREKIKYQVITQTNDNHFNIC